MKKKQKTPKPRSQPGPVAQMWILASKMNGAPRKEVIAAAVKRGINKATAATQFQRWKHASKAQRAEKVNGAAKEAMVKKSPAAKEELRHAA